MVGVSGKVRSVRMGANADSGMLVGTAVGSGVAVGFGVGVAVGLGVGVAVVSGSGVPVERSASAASCSSSGERDGAGVVSTYGRIEASGASLSE